MRNMSLTSGELEQCIHWMQLQSNCLSRSGSERAYFAMTAEWLTYWAATDLFHRDAAVRDFIEECLRTSGGQRQSAGAKSSSGQGEPRQRPPNGDPLSLAITIVLRSPDDRVC